MGQADHRTPQFHAALVFALVAATVTRRRSPSTVQQMHCNNSALHHLGVGWTCSGDAEQAAASRL